MTPARSLGPHARRLKLLPWNQAKSKRLEAELDAQLLAILRRRLAAMGMRAGGSSAAAASGSSACPFHAAAPEASQEAAAGGAQQQGPPEEGAAGAAAGQAQGVGGARDILSLAVELSAQGGAVDEQMLLSQVRGGRRSGDCLQAAMQGPL